MLIFLGAFRLWPNYKTSQLSTNQVSLHSLKNPQDPWNIDEWGSWTLSSEYINRDDMLSRAVAQMAKLTVSSSHFLMWTLCCSSTKGPPLPICAVRTLTSLCSLTTHSLRLGINVTHPWSPSSPPHHHPRSHLLEILQHFCISLRHLTHCTLITCLCVLVPHWAENSLLYSLRAYPRSSTQETLAENVHITFSI